MCVGMCASAQCMQVCSMYVVKCECLCCIYCALKDGFFLLEAL